MLNHGETFAEALCHVIYVILYIVSYYCVTPKPKTLMVKSNRYYILSCSDDSVIFCLCTHCLSGFDQRHWSTSGVRLRVAWADCSGAAKGLTAAKAGPWNIWHHMAPTKVNKRVIGSRVGDGQ